MIANHSNEEQSDYSSMKQCRCLVLVSAQSSRTTTLHVPCRFYSWMSSIVKHVESSHTTTLTTAKLKNKQVWRPAWKATEECGHLKRHCVTLLYSHAKTLARTTTLHLLRLTSRSTDLVVLQSTFQLVLAKL